MNKLLCCMLVTIAFDAAFGAVGERCFQNDVEGVIRLVGQCDSVRKNPGILKSLRIYGFDGREPLICCAGYEVYPRPDDGSTTARPVATTPRLGSTTEYVPEEYDYQTIEPPDESCPPPTATVPKTGQRAWDKCVEYQDQLIYPCEASVSILGGMDRSNHCRHGDIHPAAGYANREEYPHMALLGYRVKNRTVWRCAGTLLSDRFILTAARCQFGRKFGGTTYAMVGSRNGPENVDLPQTHRVSRVIRHPGYKAPSLYHDIALVETESQIILDQWTVPACLDVFNGEDSEAVATSWITGADRVHANTLKKLTRERCRQQLPFYSKGSRRLNHGFDPITQSCYGSHYATDPDQTKTSRGGPITIKNKRISCMYDVVGIVSIQRARRSVTSGIFTRVQYYVPWIENIVWPHST